MDVVIKVNGMSRGHCEKAIKEAIEYFEGVKHIEVNLDKSEVKIDYNQDNVSLEEICDAIEDQGYAVDR